MSGRPSQTLLYSQKSAQYAKNDHFLLKENVRRKLYEITKILLELNVKVCSKI